MYAQVIKSMGNLVTLIGGAAEGLPIEHPDVICVPVQPGEAEVGMTWSEADGFRWPAPEEPESVAPEELREQAYETMTAKEDGAPLLVWEDQSLTVDSANQKWLDYAAEGSPVSDELQTLISVAKQYVRELYPDSGEVRNEE